MIETQDKVGIETALDSLIQRLQPGSTVEQVTPFGEDGESSGGGTTKAKGYGVPRRVLVRDVNGGRRSYVFHTAKADEFGHNRRSDRAEQMILAYDTFARIPRHVPALDVGSIDTDGHLVSLRSGSEFYLLTEYRDGTPYVEDLHKIADRKQATAGDLTRVEQLATYLAGLHSTKLDSGADYRRAIRDLIGHGECIFGMVDGFPGDTPSAPPERLRQIERQCVDWRWRLRGREKRLRPVHGDFHPFNILFNASDELVLLDASRGCRGDPADDATALSINYLLFGLENPGAARQGLLPLWERFWKVYLDATGDTELLEVAPPYFAWRALVLANPKWYPRMRAATRETLLFLVEKALAAGEFRPDDVGRYLR